MAASPALTAERAAAAPRTASCALEPASTRAGASMTSATPTAMAKSVASDRRKLDSVTS